jgi:uncharacterized membrane protein
MMNAFENLEILEVKSPVISQFLFYFVEQLWKTFKEDFLFGLDRSLQFFHLQDLQLE